MILLSLGVYLNESHTFDQITKLIKLKFTIMKNYLKTIIVFVVMLYCCYNLHSQQIKRMISYTTVSEHYFSIPYTDDFKKLNDLDYNKMIAQNEEIFTEIVIDDHNFPTITKHYLNGMRYENDYENEVSKSVTNQYETILFDLNDQVLTRQPSDPSDPLFRALSEDEIRNFGLFTQMFRDSPYQMIQNLILQNFSAQYLPNRMVLIAINNDMELMVDYKQYIYEIRYFYQRNFNFSKTYQYQKYNGLIIPLLEVNIVQDSLSNQTPFIKTEIIRYKNYTIINEKGDPIVSYKNPDLVIEKNTIIKPFEPILQRDIELKVFPNPTQSTVSIEFPFYMEEKIFVDISNSLGEIVFQNSYQQNEKVEIDLSTFPNGIYFIKSACDGITKSAKIIKQ